MEQTNSHISIETGCDVTVDLKDRGSLEEVIPIELYKQIRRIKVKGTISKLSDFDFLRKLSSFSNEYPLEEIDLHDVEIDIDEWDGPKYNGVIPQSAFESTKLKRINLPASAKGIGFAAFKDCRCLTNIDFQHISTIGNQAFHGCSSLETLSLPFYITHIGSNAFEECRNLRFVRLPLFLMSLSQDVFKNCANLFSITVNPYIERIDSDSFTGCTNLSIVKFTSLLPPETEKKILPFSKCHFIVPYKSVDTYTNVFPWIKDRMVVQLPEDIEIYVDKPGDLGNNDKSFEISTSYSVKISGSINAADLYVVRCALSKKYKYYYSSKISCTIWMASVSIDISDTMIVDSICNVPNLDRDFRETIEIRSNSKSFGDVSFMNCVGTLFKLPDYIETIRARTFENNLFLNMYELPKSLKEIGSYAFAHCKTLRYIQFPKGLCVIGEAAFLGDYGVSRELNFPDSLRYLGKFAFCGADYLESVTLPSSVSLIHDGVFDNCKNLQNIYVHSKDVPYNEVLFNFIGTDHDKCILHVPHSSLIKYLNAEDWRGFKHIVGDIYSNEKETEECVLTVEVKASDNFHLKIDPRAIPYIDSLKIIGYIDGQVMTELRKQFFDFEDILPTLDLSESSINGGREYSNELTGEIYKSKDNIISPWMFYGMDKVKNLIIPKDVQSVEECAFMCCSKLESMEITEGVTYIGESAFFGCSNMSKLCLPSTLLSISLNSLSGCENLTDIFLLTSVPPTTDNSFIESFHYEQCTLHVKAGTKTEYQTDKSWKNFYNIVDDI